MMKRYALFALRRHPARRFDRRERPGAQGIGGARDVLVHRDEPLRRVTEDQRLLGSPRMRVLVLQAGSRDQRAAIPQRRDDRLIGVTLVARIGDDPFAGKARRLVGEEAVGIHRVGDGRIDAARHAHMVPGCRTLHRPIVERRILAVAGDDEVGHRA